MDRRFPPPQRKTEKSNLSKLDSRWVEFDAIYLRMQMADRHYVRTNVAISRARIYQIIEVFNDKVGVAGTVLGFINMYN